MFQQQRLSQITNHLSWFKTHATHMRRLFAHLVKPITQPSSVLPYESKNVILVSVWWNIKHDMTRGADIDADSRTPSLVRS
jgi:hypothetical protein